MRVKCRIIKELMNVIEGLAHFSVTVTMHKNGTGQYAHVYWRNLRRVFG